MQSKNIIIIPQQRHGLVVDVSGNNVNILTKIDIPYKSISKIINDERIVTLDKVNKQLLFHTIEGSYINSIKVPFGLCMNVKDNIVYVGGSVRDGEVCFCVDMSCNTLELQSITLPVFMVGGKAVDDILILGNKMLLIDNLVFPKYTFEYDISVPNKPIWVKTTELPESMPYENIIKGEMNKNWMIYLSTSSTWDDYESNIMIEGKHNNTVSKDGKDSILDICLCSNTLYALTDAGLGYFNLNDGKLHSRSIILIGHVITADRIIKIDDSRLLLVHRCGYELIYNQNLEHFTGPKKFSFICEKMILIKSQFKSFKEWF